MTDTGIDGAVRTDSRLGKTGRRARRAEIDAFLRSIAPDQYAPDTYVPWSEIDDTTRQLAEPIARLQEIVDAGKITRRELERAMRADGRILSLLHYLFASPNGAGFVDGRELPAAMPKEVTRIKAIVGAGFQLRLRKLCRSR